MRRKLRGMALPAAWLQEWPGLSASNSWRVPPLKQRCSLPLTTSERMARVGQRDTAPELRLRRALWASGLRYRLHDRRLPGTPDVVFVPPKVAVFVHGCFWHQHGCRRSKLPTSNACFWSAKLARNVQRDEAATAALARAGWLPIIVWECEDVQLAHNTIAAAVQARTSVRVSKASLQSQD